MEPIEKKERNNVIMRDVNNLTFMMEFMSLTQLTTTDIANRSNYSRQNIARIMKVDDISLAKLRTIFDRCGYELSLEYMPITPKTITTDITPKEDDRKIDEDDNLAFLKKAICKYNMKLSTIAEKTGYGYSTLFQNIYKAGDLHISQLKKIAEAFDLVLHITIKPKKSGGNSL